MSDTAEDRTRCNRNELEAVENPPGIKRTTLAYQADTMLCHFTMRRGAEIPLHSHDAVQNGYVISGKVQFRDESGDSFLATAGSGYVFGSQEKHGALVVEDAEVIECFSPMRAEYADN